jgi:hypothetical protein
MNTINVSPSQQGDLFRLLYSAEEDATIVLEAGHYKVSSLTIRGSLTLTGRSGAESTILDAGNKDRLIGVGGEGITVTLEGLTLRGAHGVFGSAVHVSNRNTAFLDGCVLADNHASQAGGAIFVRHGHVTLLRCVFTHNRAGIGGAVAAEPHSSLSVDRCYFDGNEAKLGGAVDLEGEDICARIKSSSFIDNVASHPKGGCAVFISGTATAGGPTLEILNSLFVGDRPLVKNPKRMGTMAVANCVVPPGMLSDLEVVDRGGNLAIATEMVSLESGFRAVSPESPAAGLADLQHLDPDATDLLGQPLIHEGRADPGALASR